MTKHPRRPVFRTTLADRFLQATPRLDRNASTTLQRVFVSAMYASAKQVSR